MPGGRGTRDAVCYRYAPFTTIQGFRASRGYRGDGRALDCVISDSTVWNIANRIGANAKKWGVSEVIYPRRIRTVQRSSEGGVRISDRGSPIASRTYHVDVSVYGNRAAG
jgi:hypothetical protein